jgi:transposase-like protein
MLRCPSCGSTEIYPVAGGYIGQVYLCKACRYRGSLVLEEEDEPPGRDLD